MASVVESRARISSLQREIKQQKQVIESKVNEIQNRMEKELAKYDREAKIIVEQVSRELNNKYTRLLTEIQQSYEEAVNRYSNSIDSASAEIAATRREGEERMADVASSQRQLQDSVHAERERERIRASESVRHAEKKLELLQTDTAILFLERDEFEQLQGGLQKVKEHLSRSMYQVAIALADITVEKIERLRTRECRQADSWSSNYRLYKESIKELENAWKEAKDAAAKLDRISWLRDDYRRVIGERATEDKHVKWLNRLFTYTKTKCPVDFHLVLEQCALSKELDRLVETVNGNDKIAVGEYYIHVNHLETVNNKLRDMVLMINEIPKLCHKVKVATQSVEQIVEGLQNRDTLCDWLTECFEEEGYEVKLDSREEDDLDDKLVFTRMEVDTAVGSFVLYAINTKSDGLRAFVSEQENCNKLEEQMEELPRKYLEEEKRIFYFVTPDEPDEFLERCFE